MAVYSVSEVAGVVKGELYGDGETTISYLLTDSRTLIDQGKTLFFAIIGNRNDGHDYINQLYEKGVKNFVVSKLPKDYKELKEVNFILVADTLKALHALSANHRQKYKIPIIGITGSNGKTILKEWIFHVLHKDKRIVRSPKSYNSQVGVPLSVWLLNEETDIGVFEAGISKLDEMSNLQRIIKPTIGIFTNIGEAHQENFIDYKHKISEKLKLFTGCKKLIYCKDYQLIEMQIQSTRMFDDNSLLTWSKKYPADLFISSVEKKEKHTDITARYKGGEIDITIPFIDDASIENSIHCWLLMLYLEYNNAEIKERIKLLAPVAMRLELKEGSNNCTIINDSYNSDIGSLGIALDFLKQQNQQPEKTLILSDILQSGRGENALYSEVAELVNKKDVNNIIGVGTAISKQFEKFNINKSFFNTTDELIEALPNLKLSNQVILLKGARSFRFEKISNILQHKVHETVLEINLNALVDNLNYFKSLLKPDVKLMVMVKAFSYGSGAFEIANVLQYQHVDYLAVAFADEGVELRKAGITLPILVLNPEVQSYDLMVEYRLEPEIYNFRVLELFTEAVNSNRINTFPIHIKFDTGMKRLGFSENEIPNVIKYLSKNRQLIVKSVFTHLAASDENQHDDFTNSQFKLFDSMSKQLIDTLGYPVLKHALNSAGIERFPNAQYDMVRLGIGMYGISAVDQSNLKNVSTLKTAISQIKRVSKNETVGYSRKGIVDKDTDIAIIPIGYADGLDRKLGNGVGKVLINGRLVPFIGNICMDMCMVDITDIKAEEGDQVIIFNDDYHISEIAKQVDTIPYEIMTSISQRVKRIYYHE